MYSSDLNMHCNEHRQWRSTILIANCKLLLLSPMIMNRRRMCHMLGYVERCKGTDQTRDVFATVHVFGQAFCMPLIFIVGAVMLLRQPI